MNSQVIQRNEIDAKLRELNDHIHGDVQSAKTIGMVGAASAAVVVAAVVFWVGYRRGHHKETIVEVQRL